MNTKHRYILDKSSKKFTCPECNKKRFVKYIDIETNEYLQDQYGRCDRENNCSYHSSPPETETKAVFVEVTEINSYSDKAFKIKQGLKYFFIPKSIVLETVNNGIYITEFFFKDKPNEKPVYDALNSKIFDKQYNFISIHKPKPKPKTTFIPVEVFNATRTGYEKNTFIQNLLNNISYPFDIIDIEKVISHYHLGTIEKGYRSNAITFPFIDINGNVRTIQVKEFDKGNHTTATDFLHSIIDRHHTQNKEPLPQWLEAYKKNEMFVSCLFGEHLLNKYPYNPIALVEAPKTAIYGTLYFGFPEQPEDLLWLAVYNLSSLNLDKCKALKGRKVFLFPDLSKEGKAFDLWSDKAKKIQDQLEGTYFTVSNLLEQLAPQQDKEKGKDIADYLIIQDWRKFRKNKAKPKISTIDTSKDNKEIQALPTIDKPLKESLSTIDNDKNPKEKHNTQKVILKDWTNDIEELESYFSKVELPTIPVQLNKCSTITDIDLFIKKHINTVKANNGNNTFLPYLDRLQDLRKIIINNR